MSQHETDDVTAPGPHDHNSVRIAHHGEKESASSIEAARQRGNHTKLRACDGTPPHHHCEHPIAVGFGA